MFRGDAGAETPVRYLKRVQTAKKITATLTGGRKKT